MRNKKEEGQGKLDVADLSLEFGMVRCRKSRGTGLRDVRGDSLPRADPELQRTNKQAKLEKEWIKGKRCLSASPSLPSTNVRRGSNRRRGMKGR